MSLPEVFQFSVPPSLLSDTMTEPEESTYQDELLATPLLIEDEVFKLDLDEPLIEENHKNSELFSWQPDDGEFADAAQHNYRLWLAGGN